MNIQKSFLIVVILVCLASGGVLAQGQSHYYYLPLRQLEVEGQWPDGEQTSPQLKWPNRQYLKYTFHD
ncbi:MAG: hypothetical protein ISS71_06900 [Phycisphaerae bacterium]|nr:hypothetical protein [Phycisphaerae bacterium]